METAVKIPTSDGKVLFGVLHEPSVRSPHCAILVHGLTGHMDEFLHLTFARYLANRGMAVLRFNQYDDLEGARRFHETTIRLHVADTKQVMAYARGRGFESLALVGHSLGAPVSIASVDAETRALVLWDPAESPAERIRQWNTVDKERNISYLDWRVRILLGPGWIEDAMTFPDPYEQLSRLSVPVKILAAELGGLIAEGQRYRAARGGAAALTIVPKAGHCFCEEGAIEHLSVETADWLFETM